MSEISLAGDMRKGDTGIEAIRFSLFFIPDSREEGFEVRELLQISEQFQKEEADWIVSMASPGGISRSADGSDEGEIDQGSDKTGEPAGNLSGGINLDPSGDIGVKGKKPILRFGEGLLILEVNGNTDLTEFSDHIP
jgi:hypothetical protein